MFDLVHLSIGLRMQVALAATTSESLLDLLLDHLIYPRLKSLVILKQELASVLR